MGVAAASIVEATAANVEAMRRHDPYCVPTQRTKESFYAQRRTRLPKTHQPSRPLVRVRARLRVGAGGRGGYRNKRFRATSFVQPYKSYESTYTSGSIEVLGSVVMCLTICGNIKYFLIIGGIEKLVQVL